MRGGCRFLVPNVYVVGAVVVVVFCCCLGGGGGSSNVLHLTVNTRTHKHTHTHAHTNTGASSRHQTHRLIFPLLSCFVSELNYYF